MPMLDFRVETFLAVCRHMNFTKAARELNITQPAVSHHMHYLEQAYGTALFQHNGKRLQLTEAGEILRRRFPDGVRGTAVRPGERLPPAEPLRCMYAVRSLMVPCLPFVLFS